MREDLLAAQSDLSDAEWVARVLAGEPEAFSRLVERHHVACARYARRVLGHAQDAEDVVQETFLQAYSALERYQERDHFRSWLFRILVNQCRSHFRRRSRQAKRFLLAECADAPQSTAAGDMGAADALQSALARLDPASREAILLKLGEGLDYKAIAMMTGASVSALKMRVKRARDTMRPFLKDWFDE